MNYKRKHDIGATKLNRPKGIKEKQVHNTFYDYEHQQDEYGHNDDQKGRNYKKAPVMKKSYHRKGGPGHPKHRKLQENNNKPHQQSYGQTTDDEISDDHNDDGDLYGDFHSYENKIDYGDSLEYMNISYTRTKSDFATDKQIIYYNICEVYFKNKFALLYYGIFNYILTFSKIIFYILGKGLEIQTRKRYLIQMSTMTKTQQY